MKKRFIIVFITSLVIATLSSTVFLKDQFLQAGTDLFAQAENEKNNSKAIEKMENALANETKKQIDKGDKWLNSKSNNEEVVALVTFNKKNTGQEISKIAKNNSLEVLEIFQITEYGDHAANGGYKLKNDEDLDTALNRMERMRTSLLEKQVEDLEKRSKNDRYPKHVQEAAIQKKESIEEFLSSNNNDDGIYGLKVKTKVMNLKGMGQQIAAVKKSNASDSSNPIIVNHPKQWVEGVNK
ncbi:hypothetical protein [Piscibacillus halophilus]|uniref:hypothetical protein n=1 Tax=Piscibacillus halophilus TaxID=571933 RepID=UPI00240A5F1A|nr:hypothetical protein [Piscibacillus halophilus]